MTLALGFLFYYIAALIGITIGYHRYFSHYTFTTNKYIEVVFLMFGLICGGRSALTWCAVHRYHHATSDTENDPHSPVYLNPLLVLFSTWNLRYIPKKYIIPLLKNPRLRCFHKYGLYLHITYAAIFLLLGINFFIIFVLCPLIFSWAGFGLLNYFAHKDGVPKDIPLLNLVAPGEGWHKVHHDYPNYYKLNKFDIAGVIIEKFFIKSKPSN
jgi:stearoyl-CoA desaturase (delta-9 desaturase)